MARITLDDFPKETEAHPVEKELLSRLRRMTETGVYTKEEVSLWEVRINDFGRN